MSPDSLRVNSHGLDIECIAQGRGETIVLVHGDVMDRRAWAKLAPKLARTHRVVTYSRRYHWPNPAPAPGEPNAVESHVADLVAILERVGPAHVLANSYGAYVAMVTAAARPDLVRSLLLEEPAAVTLAIDLPPTPDAIAALQKRDPELAAATGEMLGVVGGTIDAFVKGDVARGIDAFARYHLGPAIARDAGVLERAQANAAAQVAALLVGHFSPYAEADLRKIRSPTVLIVGEKSPAYLRVLAMRIRALIAGSHIADIKGVGHVMHEEDADATARVVEGFLAAQAPTTSTAG